MSVTPLSFRAGFRLFASWSKRGIGLLLLGGAAALLCFGDHVTRTIQALLAGLLLLLLMVSLRRGWVTLFGPVLPYDLVRTARRSRSFLLRCVYVAALLAVLFLLYSEWFGDSSGLLASLLEDHHVPPAKMAGFADAFFTRFLALQLGAVLLLTPVYTASALAEQKERKTLDYLLTTDLRSSEIVLGTLASRLAHLGLFLLAGLPILGLLQLLGGVDPNLVLAGFAGTVLTMVSLASLGILVSAYSERPRTAIFVTYVLAGFYLLCSFPTPGLSAGNPWAAWAEIMEGAETGTLATTVPKVLRNYAVVHGAMAVLCCVWASVRLRAWSQFHGLREPEMIVVRVDAVDGTRLVWRRAPPNIPWRPPITGDPVLWKEKYVESVLYRGVGVQAFVVFLVILGCFVASLGFMVIFVLLATGDTLAGANLSTFFVRTIGTPVAYIVLLSVALHSAAALSRERETRTWDSLLTTPLERHEILKAKAWGSILCARWGLWFLGILWVLGVLTLGLNPILAPVLAVAWLAHAALIAGIGMWFSLVSRTTLRASIYTLLALAVLTVGPVLLGGLVEPLWAVRGWIQGFSPPVNFWALAYGWGEHRGPAVSGDLGEVAAAVLGIPFVAAAATGMWFIVWKVFAWRIGREGKRGCNPPVINSNEQLPGRLHAPLADETV